MPVTVEQRCQQLFNDRASYYSKIVPVTIKESRQELLREIVSVAGKESHKQMLKNRASNFRTTMPVAL